MAKFYQLETDFRYVNCGMSYVFKLNDGRFIVYDGGYFADGQAEALHEFLKERSGDRIRVAGWFFSHAHQDHIGAFINYIRMYDDTDIECLYYNFQPADFSNISDDWKGKDDYATFHEFYVAIEEKLPGVKQHTFVKDEKFSIGEVEFEVLYTYENAEHTITNFNDNSVVFTASQNGVRILFLGDIAVEGSIALMHAPEKLACEMVQVAHHGFNGATPEIYKNTHAKIVLWPAPNYETERNSVRPANAYLLNESGMRIVMANDGTAEFDLDGQYEDIKVLPRVFPEKQ